MKSIVLKLMMVSFALGLFGCKNSDKNKEKLRSSELETMDLSEEALYRPNFHFTPKKSWMNDPNGMFFYNEYYHLYFQYYPDGNVWGPMHWGHAVSTDMISWKEQPIALYPDELGYIFSGSAVVDHNNSSGFGKDGEIPIVAMYTSHDPKKAEEGKTDVETQSIAYSLDEGLTWKKYEGNPVIKNQGDRDFRDPKVIWDDLRKQWVMVLAAGQKTLFYSSKNLKNWHLLSEFGKGVGNHDGVWECPDLFPLPIEGSEEIKWVHLVSINPGGPNGGSATQYFVGDFDGKQFTMDPSFEKAIAKEHEFWVDFGRDNYAGVTWSNITASKGGKLFIGWMSNWDYAKVVPTETWRSAMTIARELKLKRKGDGYVLTSLPVKELSQYRGKKYKKEGIAVKGNVELTNSKTLDLTKAEINFTIHNGKEAGFEFILSNSLGNKLLFGYNPSEKNFYVDRSKSGKTDFSEKFAHRITTSPRISNEVELTGTLLLDKTSIELFFDDGQTVMTEIFFPNAPFETLSVASENNELLLDYFEIHELNF